MTNTLGKCYSDATSTAKPRTAAARAHAWNSQPWPQQQKEPLGVGEQGKKTKKTQTRLVLVERIVLSFSNVNSCTLTLYTGPFLRLRYRWRHPCSRRTTSQSFFGNCWRDWTICMARASSIEVYHTIPWRSSCHKQDVDTLCVAIVTIEVVLALLLLWAWLDFNGLTRLSLFVSFLLSFDAWFVETSLTDIKGILCLLAYIPQCVYARLPRG